MQSNRYALSHADVASHRIRTERADVRIFRNEWGALTPPALGEWTPELTVSVIIAAHGEQHRLDLALAALAAQTYPAHLLEVVVVDDRSSPPLRLPGIRPADCRIARAPATGRGAGHARAHGAHATSGEIICWLDADLVVDPRHIEAHARWQHTHPEAVTIGRAGSAARYPGDPAEIAALARSGRLPEAFADARGRAGEDREPPRTDGPREADHLGFQAFTGSCAAVRRSLYEAAGGVDPSLDLGQDTEFGYRLWQTGGVFVPEHRARGWHLGDDTPARTRAPSARFSADVLAEFMPYPRSHRDGAADRIRRVPLVHAVVEVAGARCELVRACVDRLLSCTETDLAVTLVADWDGPVEDGPAGNGADTRLELGLVQAGYLADPRVRFAPAAPGTGFPSPYLLEVPVGCGIGRDTLERLLALAERSRAGITELVPAAPPHASTA
ncbi:glycosyltransferase family 2 protein, partial [Spinactinospora alkalitolerans]